MDNNTYKLNWKHKDIFQKILYQALPEESLKFCGINIAKVTKMLATELPEIEFHDSSTDLIYQLEDETILHLEFQSSYQKHDLYRFANYDLRLSEKEKMQVKTVIIYSANINHANYELSTGCLNYNPTIVMLRDYDGDHYLNEIEEKIKNGEELSRNDVVKLGLLPYTKNNVKSVTAIRKVLSLAKRIQDGEHRKLAQASILHSLIEF